MAEPIIQARGLRYAYPSGTPALVELNLDVAAGERVGVVGPNGAGKTTFFLCICGVLPIRASMVRVAGLDPAVASDRRRLPAKVGIMFQDSDDQLFNSTVLDDVAFGPLQLGLSADEARNRADRALKQVGLTGREQRSPFHLSGGEKRRAALAGILAMQPEVLLLDEPSQFLDPRGRRDFIRLLQGLSVTKVIAAHDLEMILETCDRVIVIDQGTVKADGPARQVLSDAALMEEHGLEVPHSLRK